VAKPGGIKWYIWKKNIIFIKNNGLEAVFNKKIKKLPPLLINQALSLTKARNNNIIETCFAKSWALRQNAC